MGFPRRLLGLPLAVALALGVTACGGDDDKAAPSADAQGCVESYDAATDYFPVKQKLEHATNFTLTYARNYQVLTVKQPSPGAKPQTYVLVRCGTPEPALTGELEGAVAVETPVRSLFSASTTHLPFLADLGVLDVLKGVSSAAYVTSPDVIERVQSGAVAEYASGQEIDVEKVVGAAPDVLVTDGTENPGYQPLREAGVDVLANAEWLESSPLGRAEWVKFFAALTGSEAKADQVFTKVAADYRTLADKVKNAEPTTVLPGTMYSGQWSIPNGGSYVGSLIKDAGGTYAWADTAGTGSTTLDLEAVLAKAEDASTWLVVENGWTKLADAEKADARYAKFKAFQTGDVWSANKVLGPGGGNDYWERGVARPDLILADLVAILHPDLSPGHAFTFYRKLAA
ncbi:ABC transporter substrate-binding protein [Actinocorallia sp. A-T 12471]|uniref:ABC transporter substrate-binding protein n=1 Tax=Actinocorallia sp. A-T 12471 TaxID=3089813 RepID=UPI0029D025F1|nr:ABC transporter substrate-binding protein [Actinocorallia sp. A-T 12471]MDX6742241.1 ABC transporter substrate-binding protein [Actinocorallia sp. A-T 12471]